MINSHNSSFVPLLNQLQEYGKFSKMIPAESSSVKEISDYLYSELITGIKNNRFPHSGTFFSIDGDDYRRIAISTVLSCGCHHIKCFEAERSDFELLLHYLDQVSRVYTHLFFERTKYVFHQATVMYREVSG